MSNVQGEMRDRASISNRLLGLQLLPEGSRGEDPYPLYALEALEFGITGHQNVDIASDCCWGEAEAAAATA